MVVACLFDMDGLLLDTERIYTLVTQKIVARYGKEYTWALKSRMMGMRQEEAAHLLVTELGIESQLSADAYLKERNQMQSELFASARPLPGVIRLVKHLKDAGVPIAVATSSHRDAFELKTSQNQELFALFDAIVTGDSPAVKRGKPHPDIFIEAARQLSIQDPRQCLVFEDAISGVRAAQAAGMHVCWVPDPNIDTTQVQGHVDLIINTLEKFKPEQFGLPPYPQ
jgi:HAD superfamily hydrolase (TIGR01509 family)